ncbi:hypothetical protein JG627_24730, partial [Escherichia coli]|nr:hypothetical protein [Escherichia coli]
KVNMAGGIPAIFASSIILFPAAHASWVGGGGGLEWVTTIFLFFPPGQPPFVVIYFFSIIFFFFFLKEKAAIGILACSCGPGFF